LYNLGTTNERKTIMDLNTQMMALIQNLAYNWTWLAEPVKNGVIFNYDPEAPILDKTGKPTGKTFGKLTTTIIFSDGTKCTCSNSCHDPVNATLVSEVNGVKLPTPVVTADETSKEFGITQCLFKRMIGTVKKDGTIDGAGGSRWLKQKIAESYDQGVMDVYTKALKKIQAEQNEAKHKAAAKKAHERKVRKLAKQMALKKEAEAYLETKKATKTASAKCKPLCETKKPTMTASDFFKTETYVRPNKPFSQFTQEEKRAYWREQNRRRRG